MKHSDYPCLFQKSDTASLQQQGRYLLAMKAEFLFILLSAFAGGFILIGNPKACITCSIISAVSIFLAFVVRICVQLNKWDRKWFDTRAIAESAKTATWRYIMAVEPYAGTLSQTDADKKFVEELDEIFKARPEAHSAMASCVPVGDQQISDRMREIRGRLLNQRKEIYLNQRIRDQKDWYRKKAKINADNESRWSFLILGCEVVGIFTAFGLIFWPEILFNPVGVITTLTAIFCAWVQIKNYREQSQSYAMAEQELTSIESLINDVSTDNAFSDHVVNTEGAISREHTMWCAKRI